MTMLYAAILIWLLGSVVLFKMLGLDRAVRFSRWLRSNFRAALAGRISR